MQVSLVAFKKGQLRVLSHAWDRNLGGRDLDNVLFEYFAKVRSFVLEPSGRIYAGWQSRHCLS